MHSIKRFITFVLALALALSIMTTSYAVDEVEAEELTAIDMQSDIETRAITEPTRYKNLSSGSYEARIIDLPPTRSTLTNYYFSTGTGTIKLTYNLTHSGTSESVTRVLKAYLFEREERDIFWTEVKGTTVSYKGQDGFTTTRSFTGLDPDQFYYIEFANESDASYTSKYDISGTVIISE